MGLRIGIRSIRVKIYPISFFEITNDEAENYAVKYDKYDLWNINKHIDNTEAQIEKRVRYFHFMYIPIISLGVEWTTRKKDGYLYHTTELCEEKIIKKIKKPKSPWYINLVPYSLLALILFLLIFYLIVPFTAFQIRKHKNDAQLKIDIAAYEQQINDEFEDNILDLYSIDTTCFIEFQSYTRMMFAARRGLFPEGSHSSYSKILDFKGNKVLLGFLPDSSLHRSNISVDILRESFTSDSLTLKWMDIKKIERLIPKSHKELIKIKEDKIVSRIESLNE